MSFLRVTVDGQPVAVVDTEGRDVVTIRVGGSVIDDEYADLAVAAGTYPDSGENDYRIWIDQMPLTTGQFVEVAHLEDDLATGIGKTVEELYPDCPPEPAEPLDRSKLVESMRSSPRLRNGYVFEYASPSRPANQHTMESNEFGFGFNILWSSARPESASVSLNCYSIASFAAEEPGRTVLRERLTVGGRVSLRLVA